MESLVLWLIALGVIAYAAGKLKESEFGRDVLARLSGHPRKPLIERNRDVILSYIARVNGREGGYYIDNLTRECIAEIARREKRTGLIPGHREWLSLWEKRADIPREWLEMKDRIKAALSAKHEHVAKALAKETELQRARERAREEERRTREEERIELARKHLIDANKDLIDKFAEIAERKVSVIDEYGEENWDALPQEIEKCFTKIAKRGGYDDKTIKEAFKKGSFWSFPQEYQWLKGQLEDVFREYHRRQKVKPTSSFSADGMSGVEFETLIARLLKERGFDVSGTPATGDQGADLIARKNGRTIIIQAKCYQGTVGNKAVQEVIGALAYYGGDEGWVVTNSSFTPSAKALAQKTNVKLIDGKKLEQGTLD